MKGLLVNVLRSVDFPDCTNGGISSKVGSMVIVGDLVDCNVFEADSDATTLVIREKHIGDNTYIYATPKDLMDSGKWTMNGGNFVYSSDSRFPSRQPIPVHDRVEG